MCLYFIPGMMRFGRTASGCLFICIPRKVRFGRTWSGCAFFILQVWWDLVEVVSCYPSNYSINYPNVGINNCPFTRLEVCFFFFVFQVVFFKYDTTIVVHGKMMWYHAMFYCITSWFYMTPRAVYENISILNELHYLPRLVMEAWLMWSKL